MKKNVYGECNSYVSNYQCFIWKFMVVGDIIITFRAWCNFHDQTFLNSTETRKSSHAGTPKQEYYYLKHPETNIVYRGKPQGGCALYKPNQRLCQHQSPITSIAMVQGEVLQKLTLKSTHWQLGVSNFHAAFKVFPKIRLRNLGCSGCSFSFYSFPILSPAVNGSSTLMSIANSCFNWWPKNGNL